jgi:hypothetical protein
MKNSDEPTSRQPRSSCMRRCRVRSMPTPIFGASQSSIASTWKPQRAHTSSGTGCLALSVLMMPSSTEKQATAPTIMNTAEDGMWTCARDIGRTLETQRRARIRLTRHPAIGQASLPVGRRQHQPITAGCRPTLAVVAA